MRCGACSSNASTVAGFATSTTWNSVSSRSGVASTRTSLTEQFDSGMFDYARVSVQTAATLSTNCYWWFVYKLLRRLFHIGNFCFWVPFLKQLLLRNCEVDFVEICTVYVGKMIIKAAKRIFNLIRYVVVIVIWNLASLFWNTVYIVYGRATEYLSSFGSSFYLWSSSSSPTGRSWQSFVVRQRSLQIVIKSQQSPRNRSPEQVQEPQQPRRRILHRRRMRTNEMKWSWKERRWLVKEIVVKSGISTDQRLCPKHKSTLWEPWSTSQFASPSVGCRCIPSLCCREQ